jgi:hypothetical protein
MTTEALVQQQTRLAAARSGMQIWRNNSGAYKDETGRLVRYGLGNDSSALSQYIKSSDLIGICPVTAYLQSIGWCTLGVFTALEIKAPGWKQRPGDQRAVAQARFHDIVCEAGGFAGFVTDPNDIERIVRRS